MDIPKGFAGQAVLWQLWQALEFMIPSLLSPSRREKLEAARVTVPIHRRAALKLLAASAVAPALSFAADSKSEDAKWKIALGLNGFQSGSRKYKKNYPIWEILDFAARSAFEGVELVGDWPSGGYPASAETERIRALRRLYDAYGLRVFSIQLGAGGAFDPEENARKTWLAELRERVALAKQLGCDCVGLWPGGELRGQTIDQAIERLAGTFRETGQIAGDAGLLACFEIEPPFVFNTEDHFLRILHGANHPALKGIYDPSHFDVMTGSSGHPEEMLRRVGVQNIGYVHFCDTDGTLRDGGTSKHLGCGDGHVDCAKSLKLLKEGGFHGWIMVDEWEVPDPYDACIKCKRAIDEARRG
ncbi:MAG: sugar phosphate isomerase/epimerase [Verrucomicrobiales bacterium]|nr:sugar phosphate isomerase/epimerase [Verrucomicrobiales bacterium]